MPVWWPNEVLPFFPDFPVSMQHRERIAKLVYIFTPFPSVSSRALVRAMISAHLWAELPKGAGLQAILLELSLRIQAHYLPTLAHEAVFQL